MSMQRSTELIVYCEIIVTCVSVKMEPTPKLSNMGMFLNGHHQAQLQQEPLIM